MRALTGSPKKKERGLDEFAVAIPWGNRRIAHRIVKVQAQGVVVDSTSTKFGLPQRDGRLFTFIPFVPARKYGTDIGPPEHTTMKPDAPAR